MGTHIGALTVPLAKLCQHVDAVEANPATQKLVRANLALNQSTNVELHPFAASDSCKPIKFVMNRDNSGGSKRHPLQEHAHYFYDQPEIVEVDAVPLDSILGGRSYDYILMDIEGSEYFALKGMQETLSRSKVLAMEFLPFHITDVAGVGIDEFAELLRYNFSWLYDPDRNELFNPDTMLDRLEGMFREGEQRDELCFMKSPEASFLAKYDPKRL